MTPQPAPTPLQTNQDLDDSAPLTRGGVVTQTWALFVDAYRDLNHRKLFWVTLGLSVLIAASFAALGITPEGVTIFGSVFSSDVTSRQVSQATLYTMLYSTLAVPYWFGLAASILALVSVAGIFPDLLTGGAIDLYLSKPIGRLRLFLTRYFLGLLFVALQVLAFALTAWLVLGIRAGAWGLGIFLSVPIVTLFFSYLFCVCTLVGVVTRSTLAAILVTVLFWFVVFIFNATDAILAFQQGRSDYRVEQQQKLVEMNAGIIANNAARAPADRSDMRVPKFYLTQANERLDQMKVDQSRFHFWHGLTLDVKALLPKTAETIDLLHRATIDKEAEFTLFSPPERKPGDSDDRARRREEDQAGQRGAAEQFSARSVAGWVIGTSLLFEAAVLAVAGWVFCRRDY